MEQQILNTLRKLNKGVALIFGLVLLGCAIFVLLDIVLRQLGSSFGGTDEISGYVMAIVTSWGMAYTMLELGHVRIDILRSRTTGLGRALFDLFSMVVLSGTISLIALKCWPVVERSITNGSTANTPLETPLLLVQLPWFAGWLWFALNACIVTLLATSMVIRGKYAASEQAIGAFAEQEMLQ